MIPGLISGFGSLFALFFASVLFCRPSRGGANYFLAGFIVALGLSITYESIFPTGLYRLVPCLVKTYIPGQFLVGPLLFLYVSALADRRFALKWPMILHFLPFLASLAYLSPFFLEPASAKTAFVDAWVNPARTTRPEEWAIWLYLQASLWCYSSLSLLKYRRYRLGLRDLVSDIGRYARNWLLLFLVCVQVMLFCFAVIDVLMLRGAPLVRFNAFIACSLVFCIVFVGWVAMGRLDLISALPQAEDGPEPEVAEQGSEKWTGLFALVEDATRSQRLYRSADLMLPDLARSLGYSRTELSKVINLGGKVNYYDFINRLRVEEVRCRLDSGPREVKILDIAMESGFNSKSTFNEAFKRWTGLTPSAYRRSKSV
jgi:AraC-like DNA-binding protein